MAKGNHVGLLGLLLGSLSVSACTAELGGGAGDESLNFGENSAREDDSGEDGRLIVGRSLRRLSTREIENTLDTLFPELSGQRLRFPLEGYELFDNEEAHTDNGQAFIENAALVMSALVEQARNVPELWQSIEVCDSETETSVCLGDFYDAWAPILLRRPGDAVERAQFVALAELDLGTRSDAVSVALEALLRHADFLHRVELGEGSSEVRTLTHQEILGRLSFFLWGEAPDSALIIQAKSVDLHDALARGAFAQVMLGDARARVALMDYHAQWIGFSTMARQGVGEDMWLESQQLIERVLFDEKGSYDEMFLLSESFLTPRLALHYHLPAPVEPSWVTLEGGGRAGILGHGSFLSSFANVGDTSPTKRGKNVQNRLLCRNIQLPEVSEVDVDAAPEPGQCYTEFLEDVHAQGACATCHELLDGVGFGLDAFDRFGVHREHERDKEECAIAGEGFLDGRPFSGPAELGRLIVEHEDFGPCVATQLVRFFSGFDSSRDKQAKNWASALSEEFAANGHDFVGLLIALVESPEFSLVAPR